MHVNLCSSMERPIQMTTVVSAAETNVKDHWQVLVNVGRNLA
jgi:hypothetical protein